MAVKFAFLAALCFAQAFAFPSEDLGEEVNKAIGNKDLRIIMGCFRNQQFNVMKIKENIAKVAEDIVDGIENDLKVPVREQLEQLEKPVARIGIALVDIHGTMYTYLNRLNIPKAFETLVAGIHTVEGIMGEIRTALNQVKVEHPEMSHALDWYMRSLAFEMDVMIPKMRRDYGECLVIGNPSVLD